MSSDEMNTPTKILEATWQLMEQRRGQGVSMSDIARTAGLSRQAVYDHFGSRTDLMIATTNYVNEVKNLDKRLQEFQKATSGIALLEASVDIWGNYIPEFYGMAKAMLTTRETDEATAAAWDGCMTGLRDLCQQAVDALDREGILAPQWSRTSAVETYLTILSVYNWEQLTIECGWSNDQYIDRMQMLLKRAFVENPF